MSDVIVDETGLQNIANAIRNKLNTSNTYLPSEMGAAINNIVVISPIDMQDASNFFAYNVRYNDMNSLLLAFNNVIKANYMFYNCINLTSIPNWDATNVIYMNNMCGLDYNLTSISNLYTPNVTNISSAFYACNNLSNASIQNIINMCLVSNIPASKRNLSNTNLSSPFYNTKFNNSYYSNRLSELTAAGWSY